MVWIKVTDENCYWTNDFFRAKLIQRDWAILCVCSKEKLYNETYFYDWVCHLKEIKLI